jgi:hypothetical protein
MAEYYPARCNSIRALDERPEQWLVIAPGQVPFELGDIAGSDAERSPPLEPILEHVPGVQPNPFLLGNAWTGGLLSRELAILGRVVRYGDATALRIHHDHRSFPSPDLPDGQTQPLGQLELRSEAISQQRTP